MRGGIKNGASPLIENLRAALAGLGRARSALGQGRLSEVDELWPLLEQCAQHLVALDRNEQNGVAPLMLALLDELERTIAAFGTEHQHLQDKLKSASRNMVADAAYRRIGNR